MKKIKSFKNFSPSNESKEEIDNFTARYYDNYDDEEDPNIDNYEVNSTEYLKKIQLFEDFIKNL